MNKQTLVSVLIIALFAVACSSTKNLEEGELLYVGAKVEIKDTAISKKERNTLKSSLSNLVRPKPNKKFLGMRPKLFIYNLAGKSTKEKGFKHWLKFTVGEPPVLFSQVDLDYTKSVLQNYTENQGYFNTRSTADSTRSGKKATANYVLKIGKQYKIKSVQFPTDSTSLGKAIQRITRRRSLLKVGTPYNLDLIKAERVRIDTRLKEKGFYYFNADYLKVQVDSTVANHEVDLILKVKEDTPENAKKDYKINNIFIYPNYSLTTETSKAPDSIEYYKDYTIINNQKLFKPRVFDQVLYFKKGDVYNRKNHNLSLNRLVNLGTFKFVKNQFKVSDTTGNYLDTYYYLTPLPRKSIRVEVVAKTNSANYSGTELNINWSNRNTFHGAELLTLSAFGGVEVQVSGQNNGFNVYRFGGEANLIWPRFIAPIPLKSSSGFVPKTKATLGYEFQNRTQLYSLQTVKGSFGYLWKENERKEHQLNVTEITYVSPQNVTDLYRSQALENDALNKVIEKQLIFGPTYSYTYSNTMQKRKKNTIYYKGGLDLAGTFYGLLTGAKQENGVQDEILSVPYSQFVKTEHEFRFFHKLGQNAQLASRLIAGVGIAYGNSSEMPFIKQFFIGGTNSIRAFRARSLGPGTFDGSQSTTAFLPDQSGDVKLEFSTEYRAKIYSVVNGAIFLDAGNIWLLNNNTDKPGSKFSSKFLDELAVGVGAGLRFDFSFLVLRTDLAFPIRKPFLAAGNRWVLDQINFGSGPWRSENLVFNLAIGYPF